MVKLQILLKKHLSPKVIEGQQSLNFLLGQVYFHSRLTVATFRGQQTFAGRLGQQPIFGKPSGPATDLVWPEAAHSLLWPIVHNLLSYLRT